MTTNSLSFSFEKYDRVLSYTPIVSTVKGLVQLIHKIVLISLVHFHLYSLSSKYETFVCRKNWRELFVSLLPIFGNIYLYCVADRTTNDGGSRRRVLVSPKVVDDSLPVRAVPRAYPPVDDSYNGGAVSRVSPSVEDSFSGVAVAGSHPEGQGVDTNEGTAHAELDGLSLTTADKIKAKSEESGLNQKEWDNSVGRYAFNLSFVPAVDTAFEKFGEKDFLREREFRSLFEQNKALFEEIIPRIPEELDNYRQGQSTFRLGKDGSMYNFLCFLLAGKPPYPGANSTPEDLKKGQKMLHYVFRKVISETDLEKKVALLRSVLLACTGCQVEALAGLEQIVCKSGAKGVDNYLYSRMVAFVETTAEALASRAFYDEFKLQKERADNNLPPVEDRSEGYKDKVHVMRGIGKILYEQGVRCYPGVGFNDKNINRKYILDKFEERCWILGERGLFIEFEKELHKQLGEFVDGYTYRMRGQYRERPSRFLSRQKEIDLDRLWNYDVAFKWLQERNMDADGNYIFSDGMQGCFFSEDKLRNNFYNSDDLKVLLDDPKGEYTFWKKMFPSRLEILQICEKIGLVKKADRSVKKSRH